MIRSYIFMHWRTIKLEALTCKHHWQKCIDTDRDYVKNNAICASKVKPLHWGLIIYQSALANIGLVSSRESFILLHVTSIGTNPPAHSCSLTSTVIYSFLASEIISVLGASIILIFYLFFVTEQNGLNFTWSQVLKTGPLK